MPTGPALVHLNTMTATLRTAHLECFPTHWAASRKANMQVMDAQEHPRLMHNSRSAGFEGHGEACCFPFW